MPVRFVCWFLDIDECLNEDSLCEHGQCTNKAGSYECECEIGYIPAEDKKSCVGKTLLLNRLFCSFLKVSIPLNWTLPRPPVRDAIRQMLDVVCRISDVICQMSYVRDVRHRDEFA